LEIDISAPHYEGDIMNFLNLNNTVNKKVVVLRAPVLTQSGYGVHSRQIFKWLSKRDDIELFVQPLRWGMTTWLIDSNDPLINDILQRCLTLEKKPDVSIQVQLPNEWDPSLAYKNIGVTAAVETDICNPAWGMACNRMDEVIVPSTFTRDVLLSAGAAQSKVSVIPESYLECLDKENAAFPYEIPDLFNILFVGQLTGGNSDDDRKNIFNTIRVLCDTFKDRDDIGLVLKINSGKCSKIDRDQTLNTLRRFISKNRKGQFPKITFLHGNFNDEEMSALYKHKNIKAFVSLTRGEGFGLPLLEAAAAGLPVVATNWSGHLDFLSIGNFIKINYDLRQIPKSRVSRDENHAFRIFLENAKWANPDEVDFAKKIKRLVEKYELPKQWADDLAIKVKKEFSQQSIENKYNNFFNEKNLI